MPHPEAERGLDVHANALRDAAATDTDTVLNHRDGARRPTVRVVQRPAVDAAEARLDLAPGAVRAGELAGTSPRAGRDISIQPWRRLSPAEREAVAAEAASLPLPGDAVSTRVLWPA